METQADHTLKRKTLHTNIAALITVVSMLNFSGWCGWLIIPLCSKSCSFNSLVFSGRIDSSVESKQLLLLGVLDVSIVLHGQSAFGDCVGIWLVFVRTLLLHPVYDFASAVFSDALVGTDDCLICGECWFVFAF